MKKTLSLYELNGLVRKTIELTMGGDYWVEAELSEAHEVRGHCFLELIQKEELSNTPVAKASAKIWASRWMVIRSHFERITGQHLKSGMKVLLNVTPSFHEAYGFSWIVNDIDPTYTMGDMMRKRLEIIERLKQAGIFELNKELKLPLFTQRIAVISSETAAGYGDFCHQLENNTYGLYFKTRLFPAVMQGEQVEQSIIAALNTIFHFEEAFDAVVIIRGGGASSDLSGFDTYELAENVAQFPLPIITGIGHERDDTILDLISHTRVKTPTAAAEFLIGRLENVYEHIEEIQSRIVSTTTQRLDVERILLDKISTRIPILFSLVKTRQESRLDSIFQEMTNLVSMEIERDRHHLHLITANIFPQLQKRIMTERHRIEMLTQRTEAANPDTLLKRGYSITLYKGRTVHSPELLKTGEEIETKVEKGIIKSIIK